MQPISVAQVAVVRPHRLPTLTSTVNRFGQDAADEGIGFDNYPGAAAHFQIRGGAIRPNADVAGIRVVDVAVDAAVPEFRADRSRRANRPYGASRSRRASRPYGGGRALLTLRPLAAAGKGLLSRVTVARLIHEHAARAG